MVRFNRVISTLPIVIVYWWGLLLLIVRSDFYYNNYILIDNIDTFIVGFSLLHLLLFSKYYNDYKKKFVLCMLTILQIQLLNVYLNEKTYYILYTIAIITPILCTNFYTKKTPLN